jgi:hypothetical protein
MKIGVVPTEGHGRTWPLRHVVDERWPRPPAQDVTWRFQLRRANSERVSSAGGSLALRPLGKLAREGLLGNTLEPKTALAELVKEWVIGARARKPI